MKPALSVRPVFLGLVAIMAFATLAGSVRPSVAEEVRLEHVGLSFLGNLELPQGKTLAQAPVALVLHGTLGHHDMEIIKALQAGLRTRGIATLAITLSLGLDSRRGAFACEREHDHRSADATDEIGAWIAWLEGRGAKSPTLVGHSRGAQQVASYVASTPKRAANRLVLVAPLSDTAEMAIQSYRTAFAGDLSEILADAKKRIDAGEEDTLIQAPGFLYCRAARVTAAAFADYYDPAKYAVPLGILGELENTVLVVAGSDDRVAPDVAARLAARPPNPRVTLQVIDGADHFFRDLFADDLADVVSTFIHRP